MIRPSVGAEDENSWSARVKDFSAGDELTHLLGNVQLPEPRHTTLYQSLPSSSSLRFLSPSGGRSLFNLTHIYSITTTIIPQNQFGKDK